MNKSDAEIRKEVELLRKKYPDNVAIYVTCKDGLLLPKHKFLVNANTTVGQFLGVLRNKLKNKTGSSTALFILVNNIIPPSSELLHSVYDRHKDEVTLMLKITLCSENTFGK
uniref:Autophagy-related protein n=1 Tax=viral metagenome TaxID=1070528 RepID=A0A6C0E112_9ZZZZ